MKSTPIINSLVAGVITPRCAGRRDIQQYYQSAEDLLNTLIECYGGGKNRAGFRFVAETKDSDKESCLRKFNFNDTEAYQIELGDYYMRFYRHKAQIVVTSPSSWSTSHSYVQGDFVDHSGTIYYCLVAHSSGTFATDLAAGKWVAQDIYEIPAPYAEDEIKDVIIVGTADIAYLFHKDHPIIKLSRTGHTSWTLAEVDFSTGSNRPGMMPYNKETTTITPATVSGTTVTLTASASLFDINSPSLHIGSIWKINSSKSVSADTWLSDTAYSVGGYVEYNDEIYHCLSAHTSGASFLADKSAGRWSHQDIYVKITAVTDATHATGTVLYGDYLEPSPVATADWAEGAWSAKRGYPRAGTFSEQRLVVASTPSLTQSVWCSVTGEYENFKLGSDDADGLYYDIGTDQVETIRWLFPADQLALGASGGVHSMGSGSNSTPMTPSNIFVKKQTSYGVRGSEPVNPAHAIPPIGIGSYAYYFQKYGRKLREYVYNVNTDKFEAYDSTALAEHITKSGVIDMAYQQEPDNILWCVLANGKMATFTRQIEQKVQAWTPIDTLGYFESVSTIPGENEDEVWVIVKRTINGVTKRYVEVLERREFEEQEDWFFVDSGLSLDSPIEITDITQANPGVVTAAGHGLSNGDIVKIRGVEGMTEVNYKKYKVAEKTTDTFKLHDLEGNAVDTSAYTAYEYAGEVRKCVITITGLSHLEGEEVSVLVDGADHPACTVTSGMITLNGYYSEVHVGLPYVSRILTNDLESQGGGTQGKIRKVFQVTIKLYKSMGCKVGTLLKQDRIGYRTSGMPMDKFIEAYTGDKGPITFPGDWTRQKQILIEQDKPMAMHVLSIIPEMESN